MKKAISSQKSYQPGDQNLLSMGFPPRIEISIIDVPPAGDQNSEPLELHVQGLNVKSIFQLLPGESKMDKIASMKIIYLLYRRLHEF